MTVFPQQRLLFHLLGVPVYVTPRAWQIPLLWIPAGSVIALVVLSDLSLPAQLGWGIIYGVLAFLSFTALHLGGHILSGRSVDAVMHSAIMDHMRVHNIYTDAAPQALSPRIHFTRAVGGPLANFAAALVMLVLWLVFRHHVLVFVGAVNLLLGISALFPVSGLDGEVIWREIGRLRSN